MKLTSSAVEIFLERKSGIFSKRLLFYPQNLRKATRFEWSTSFPDESCHVILHQNLSFFEAIKSMEWTPRKQFSLNTQRIR